MPTSIQTGYDKGNLLNRAKRIFSFNKIFYNESKNIKQILINSGFPNYLIDEQIKLMFNNKNKINDKSYVNQNNYINLFYCYQMHPKFRLKHYT